MKLLATLSLLLLLTPIWSQSSTDNNFQTKDQTIEVLYSVISGDAGEERDWELFKSLFTLDAKLIPIQTNKQGELKASYLSPQDYIDRSGAWLVENGFFEKEMYREEDCFANICHLFSTYEAFRSSEDTEPFMRGINSIQMMYDNNRWWIINISWQAENKEYPLPTKYLPKH